MTTHALRRPSDGALDREWLHEGMQFALDHFLLLPLGGLIALVWANLAPESYFSIAIPLRFPVNDIGMALFFALVTQEIVEAVVPGGALHTWRRWTLPFAAAVGAVVVSTLTYVGYVAVLEERVLVGGWPAAAAVDIAFVYMLARSIYPRHAALPFALVVAVCADVMLALAGARVPFAGVQAGGVTLLVAALAIALVMRLQHIRSFWPYLFVCGPLAWWALRVSGFHPALALVPIVPFVPHAPRSLVLFEDRPHSAHDSYRHLEHVLKYPVQVVLFFFGLVNAGVLLSGYGTGTWALLAGSLLGKPLGLLAGTALAVALGLHLPRGLHWRDLAVVATATTGGFAFALFFATAVMPLGPIQTELKIGAILSGVGVPLTFAMARVWRVGRFSAAYQHDTRGRRGRRLAQHHH